MKIITKKISKLHNDSFWYDGVIALAKTKAGTELKLIACGDIRINSKEGNIVYDCKERNEGIKGGLKNDKDLKKIGNNYSDNYYWENNNWFEVLFKLKKEGCWDSIMGDVVYDYDTAIQLLKDYAKSVNLEEVLK